MKPKKPVRARDARRPHRRHVKKPATNPVPTTVSDALRAAAEAWSDDDATAAITIAHAYENTCNVVRAELLLSSFGREPMVWRAWGVGSEAATAALAMTFMASVGDDAHRAAACTEQILTLFALCIGMTPDDATRLSLEALGAALRESRAQIMAAALAYAAKHPGAR